MLGCVVVWFVSFNAVMTSDKFVYLFGRVIPALSLVLSMTLLAQVELGVELVRVGVDIVASSLKHGLVIAFVAHALGYAVIIHKQRDAGFYGLLDIVLLCESFLKLVHLADVFAQLLLAGVELCLCRGELGLAVIELHLGGG